MTLPFSQDWVFRLLTVVYQIKILTVWRYKVVMAIRYPEIVHDVVQLYPLD